MGILTYKQYKLLHENLDSVIGLSTPKSVGIQNEAPQLFGMMSKMAKKMGDVPPGLGKPGLGKKPPMGDDMGDMGGDMGDPDMDMGDDLPDDEEDVDDDDMGDEEDIDDDDMDDEDGDDDADDMGDEDGEGDEEDMGDDAGMGGMDMGMGMGPMGAGSPPPGMGGPMAGPDMGMGLGGPPMMGKKKPKMMSMGGMQMKPSYMRSSYMRKEAADPQDAKMKGQNRKNGANDQNDCGPGPASKKTTTVREAGDPQDAKMKGQNRKNGANDQNDCGPGPASKKTTTVREGKCCEKCGNMMSKKCKKMTREQREFNDSLMRQAGSLKFQQDELGFWVPVKEDVLVPAQKQQAQDEPQAGEVGFAPQSKIGLVGSSFTEWATRHNNAVKKNRK